MSDAERLRQAVDRDLAFLGRYMGVDYGEQLSSRRPRSSGGVSRRAAPSRESGSVEALEAASQPPTVNDGSVDLDGKSAG